MELIKLLKTAYVQLTKWAGPVVLSLFLLLLRIVWGWQFFITGKAHLQHIQQFIGFFQDLKIPLPTLNAWFVGGLECVGGLLLLIGIGTRPLCIALAIDMVVAYILGDTVAAKALFTDGDINKFSAAAPFWFLFTSLVVLALGPGWVSADGVLKFCCFRKEPPSTVLKI